MQDFRRLRVTESARVAVRAIYHFTRDFPRDEQFGLSRQMRRAAVSIVLNIVEGFSRSTTKEFLRYLEIARGSAVEVDISLVLSEDLGFGDAVLRGSVADQVNRVIRELSALITALRNRLGRGDRR